jgi:hypothetical protein
MSGTILDATWGARKLRGGSLAESQPQKRQCNQKSQEDNAHGPEHLPDESSASVLPTRSKNRDLSALDVTYFPATFGARTASS